MAGLRSLYCQGSCASGALEAADTEMLARQGCFAGAFAPKETEIRTGKVFWIKLLLDLPAVVTPKHSQHASWASQTMCFI